MPTVTSHLEFDEEDRNNPCFIDEAGSDEARSAHRESDLEGSQGSSVCELSQSDGDGVTWTSSTQLSVRYAAVPGFDGDSKGRAAEAAPK